MKATPVCKQERRGGFSLLVVLFFIASISTFMAILAFSSSQRAFTVTRLTDDIKAQAMAEAGCEYGYSILSTDWSARLNPEAFSNPMDQSAIASFANLSDSSLMASIGDASFSLDVQPVGDSSAIVTSTGTCGDSTAVSIISVQDIGGSDDDGDVLDAIAMEYSILCGGSLDFSGCGTISSPSGEAKFHSNGNMFLRGTTDALIDLSSSTSIKISNNVTVGGDVVAPALSYNSSKVTFGGTPSQANVPIVEIPDIDLTPYYNWALEHGEVHNGFTATANITPNGGILWVNGDVHISSHAVVEGTIIATGNINISGQVDINPTTCAFSLVSRDGDIQITSGGTITGLIYAKTGSLQHTANGEIRGQMIVNGDIKKAGNSDIMAAFSPVVPVAPGSSVTTEYIAIAAWQK